MRKRAHRVTRRDALKLGAAGAALVAATGVSMREALGQAFFRPIRVRRNINDPNFGGHAAALYRAGVDLLRNLPANDVRNWMTQADIHRRVCPHGNWFFLPWHRAYLMALENIIADALNEPAFAMPYWNWTIDRIMPPAVAADMIAGQPNPLFNPTRVMMPNQTLTERLSPFGIDAEAIFGETAIDAILDARPFQAFGSFKPIGQDSTDPMRWQRAGGTKARLEREPHDFCHGAVGGEMGSPPTAGRDPIFYLHHGNIDRIWARWNAGGGLNETDPLWSGFTFVQNFWDPSGVLFDAGVSQLFDTLALGYRYDDVLPPLVALTFTETPQMAAASTLEIIGEATANAPARPGQVTALTVSATGDAVSMAAGRSTGLEVIAATGPRVYALIKDITVPSDQRVGVRVFVNHPDPSPETPSDDPHYAGSFTFFAGAAGEMEGMTHDMSSQSVAIDITETLAAVQRAGIAVDNQIVVQLLPAAGADVEAAAFTVGSVEIATF